MAFSFNDLEDLFKVGEYYPHPNHEDRIMRYKYNRRLFKNEDVKEIYSTYADQLTRDHGNLLYIAVNFPGLICKKSADFLFGETPVFSAGRGSDSPEQKKLDEYIKQNGLHKLNYMAALSAAYRGDAFYKIRWGQKYEGALPPSVDPFRIFIELQNPEYVFPQAFPTDATKIAVYHVAYPVQVDEQRWELYVESHYPGLIKYRRFLLDPLIHDSKLNEIVQWKITQELTPPMDPVNTGVPHPLIVHVPNTQLDDVWEGVDDLSEHLPLFEAINVRISAIGAILDKHADPLLVVPAGSLAEDENGNPTFVPGRDKVIEVMDNKEVIPQYVTWDGQLQAAFEHLKHLIDKLLMTAELPPVALGGENTGTSGSTSLAVKLRMNSLISKINRKRQFFDEGLKRVITIAQMLEQQALKKKGESLGFEIFEPHITFADGLPKDDLEQAQIEAVRLGGKAFSSLKAVLMRHYGYTEEQAEEEIKRIEEDETRGMVIKGPLDDKFIPGIDAEKEDSTDDGGTANAMKAKARQGDA